MAPGLRITDFPSSNLIIVDSIPIRLAPPLRIISWAHNELPNSSFTASAVVGDTAPNLFALGAATPIPPIFSNSESKSSAIKFDGILRPTNSCSPVKKSFAISLRLKIKVIGPGQNCSARVNA